MDDPLRYNAVWIRYFARCRDLTATVLNGGAASRMVAKIILKNHNLQIVAVAALAGFRLGLLQDNRKLRCPGYVHGLNHLQNCFANGLLSCNHDQNILFASRSPVRTLRPRPMFSNRERSPYETVRRTDGQDS